MEITYKKNKEIQFINPYTFVPIQNKGTVKTVDINKQYHYESELYTGYMKCNVYVKTPLAIPDTDLAEEIEVGNKDAEKQDKHMKYPFFSYGTDSERKLIIPGSSIRGEVRSFFEAATDSCMSTLRPDTKLSRRVIYLVIKNRQIYSPSGGCALARICRCRKAAVLGAGGNN